LLFGFIEFLGAIIVYFSYNYFVFHGDLLWMEDVPAWSQILPFFIWLLICLIAPLLGNSRFKRHLTRQDK
jgi:hypothetical protein